MWQQLQQGRERERDESPSVARRPSDHLGLGTFFVPFFWKDSDPWRLEAGFIRRLNNWIDSSMFRQSGLVWFEKLVRVLSFVSSF